MIDTSLSSSNFYFLLAFIQGVILAGFIIFLSPRKKAHLFVGLLLVLLSFSLLHIVLEESISRFNSKFPFPMDFGLAFGPLAWFHVLSIHRKNWKWKASDWLHFLPSFLLDGALFLAFFTFIRHHTAWAEAHILQIQTVALSTNVLGVSQLGIYSFLIRKEMRSSPLGDKVGVELKRWPKIIYAICLSIIIYLSLTVPIALYFIQVLDENSFLLYKSMGSLLGVSIYAAGYYYLIQVRAQLNSHLKRVDNIKFQKEELIGKLKELIEFIQNSEVFKDSRLNLGKLAQIMGWPINDLSKVINEGTSQTFNEFINTFRIEEFKKMASPEEVEKYSIQGLAEKVGFGSKASFYRAFKKETGLTPSEFLKKDSM
ncbi:MAG: helix-turn-helix domain-containing protein [Bacteroidota bacterium]